MREKIQQRLEELKNEYEKGKLRLHELQQERSHVHETLLRIGGAIQMLTEVLEESSPDTEKDHVHEPEKNLPHNSLFGCGDGESTSMTE